MEEIKSKSIVFSVTDYDGIVYSFKVELETNGIEDTTDTLKENIDKAVDKLSEDLIKKLKEHALNKIEEPVNGVSTYNPPGMLSIPVGATTTVSGTYPLLTTGTCTYINPNYTLSGWIYPTSAPALIKNPDENLTEEELEERKELIELEKELQKEDSLYLKYKGKLYGTDIWTT